jgi:hypothetical protein
MNPSTALLFMAEACQALAAANKPFNAADMAQHAQHLQTMAREVGRLEVSARRMEHRLDEIVRTFNAPVSGENVLAFPARDWTKRQGVVS